MKLSNETKVGSITAIAITILILGYNFMKGENLFTSYNKYYAAYDDVEGLFKSNPVMINGYKVGQVSDVQMDPKTLKLLIEVKVPKTIKVSKDAVIKIVNIDLIGSKGVNVIMGKSHEIAFSGDTLRAEKDQGISKTISKLLTPLSEKINVLLSELNNQISGDEIRKTLENLNKTLVTIEGTVKETQVLISGKNEKIEGILNNLNAFSVDLRNSTPKINCTIANLEETSAELNKLDLDGVVKQLKAVIADLSQTIENINKGQGSLGKLATDDELYKKLNVTLESFKKLAEDIEKYPDRYTGFTKKQRKKADKEKQKADPKE